MATSKKNKYPLTEKAVIYSHKKHLSPIPETGKKYHCFDDGKITFSRHFIIQVDEVLGHQQFKKKYPNQFIRYRNAVKNTYWLLSAHSDKFIITHNGENDEFGVYVRTKQGGWFGIGNWWNSALLDATGKAWKHLVENIDNFDYTKEEKEKLIKENII